MSAQGESGKAPLERGASGNAPISVERGMLLLLRDERPSPFPVRYKLWTVTAVRKGAKASKVTLLSFEDKIRMEATATFPGGVVAQPRRTRSGRLPNQRRWARVTRMAAEPRAQPLKGTPLPCFIVRVASNDWHCEKCNRMAASSFDLSLTCPSLRKKARA